MCFHLPSRLYGIRGRPEHKCCQDKKRKGIDRYSPCLPTLFLVAGSPFGTNVVRPLSSQIYLVRTTKIAGPSLQNTTFTPMLFNYFNIFKSFKCFKGPRDHATPTFLSLKVKVYNVKVKVYNVKVKVYNVKVKVYNVKVKVYNVKVKVYNVKGYLESGVSV